MANKELSIGIRVTRQLHKDLKALASKQGRSLSDTTHRYLEAAVRAEKLRGKEPVQ